MATHVTNTPRSLEHWLHSGSPFHSCVPVAQTLSQLKRQTGPVRTVQVTSGRQCCPSETQLLSVHSRNNELDFLPRLSR